MKYAKMTDFNDIPEDNPQTAGQQRVWFETLAPNEDIREAAEGYTQTEPESTAKDFYPYYLGTKCIQSGLFYYYNFIIDEQ